MAAVERPPFRAVESQDRERRARRFAKLGLRMAELHDGAAVPLAARCRAEHLSIRRRWCMNRNFRTFFLPGLLDHDLGMAKRSKVLSFVKTSSVVDSGRDPIVTVM